MKIRLLEVAELELDEAISFYNSEVSGLGNEFLQEFLNSLKRIQTFPTAWHPFSENTRRCQLKRFPYGIIYAIGENEILIAAISHLHRKPEYWKNRLPP